MDEGLYLEARSFVCKTSARRGTRLYVSRETGRMGCAHATLAQGLRPKVSIPGHCRRFVQAPPAACQPRPVQPRVPGYFGVASSSVAGKHSPHSRTLQMSSPNCVVCPSIEVGADACPHARTGRGVLGGGASRP